MATITPVALVSETLTAAPFAATAPGGDVIQIANPDVDHVIEFVNGAAGAVVPTVANNVGASLVSNDYGKVEKADLSVSIAAGATRCIFMKAKDLKHYLSSSSQIALTYTSHDVLLTVRCLQLA